MGGILILQVINNSSYLKLVSELICYRRYYSLKMLVDISNSLTRPAQYISLELHIKG
jgi:hypothetical protein